MVIDTGIFIEHLRAKDKLNTTLYLLPDDSELFISAVSLYELYMGASAKEKEIDVRTLTEDIRVLPFTDSVAFKAAQLYHLLKRQNKMIEFRDIFIAATCIVNELPLMTLNKKHFMRVEELKLV
ncbi:MAG: type toxin-antitoxin system VapC family toxin [Mucilaginibacter sp.]|jgi:tRNA(fMet)-specific endonuclease VapC|nr:type toxin-antitoxin system VapC family toxin [Mucilaginibacter sp.]